MAYNNAIYNQYTLNFYIYNMCKQLAYNDATYNNTLLNFTFIICKNYWHIMMPHTINTLLFFTINNIDKPMAYDNAIQKIIHF